MLQISKHQEHFYDFSLEGAVFGVTAAHLKPVCEAEGGGLYLRINAVSIIASVSPLAFLIN